MLLPVLPPACEHSKVDLGHFIWINMQKRNSSGVQASLGSVCIMPAAGTLRLTGQRDASWSRHRPEASQRRCRPRRAAQQRQALLPSLLLALRRPPLGWPESAPVLWAALRRRLRLRSAAQIPVKQGAPSEAELVACMCLWATLYYTLWGSEDRLVQVSRWT